MGVYFILLFIPIILQHVTLDHRNVNYQKRNIASLSVFFIILTILVMLRHEGVGNDTRNYIHIFNNFSNMPWSSLFKDKLEIGFVLYNKIVSIFSKDPRFFLALTAIIINCIIYKTYKRLCVDSSLTIVLFCTLSTFIMLFSGIRQMLAVAIGFIAYEFVRNKKLVAFIIVVCFAVLVHTSAFMLFFMYPIYHANVTKKWLYIVIPVLCLIWVFNRPIFTVLSVFIERYTKYDASITSTGAFSILFLFIIFTVFAFLIPDESRIDKETNGLRNFLLFSLVLQMFAPLHMLAMRMN